MKIIIRLQKYPYSKTYWSFNLIELKFINTCQVWSINFIMFNLFIQIYKTKKLNYMLQTFFIKLKNKINKLNEIYIDCEWTNNSKIYILGYAYNKKNIYFLYEKNLSKKNVKKILKNIDYIYIYGPDIAYIEKNFNIDIKNNYKCINLLKLTKHLLKLDNYKLSNVEKHFKIKRTTIIYKNNIRILYKDWLIKSKRKQCLQYNKEDVYNLILIKEKMFTKFKISEKFLENFVLK